MFLKLPMLPAIVAAFFVVGPLQPADAAETPPATLATTLADPRVDESSSLVISEQVPDVVYTANDENDPVYAVQLSTGQVVGSSRLVTSTLAPKKVTRWVRRTCSDATGTCTKTYFTKKHKNTHKRKVWINVEERKDVSLVDPEAMSMDGAGKVWLADLGDNNLAHHGGALYSFDEPGVGDDDTVASRYPIAFPDGQSYNVETLLINPVTDQKLLVSKTLDGSPAHLFALPDELSTETPNVAVDLNTPMPTMISDGDFSPDGTKVVLRDGTKGSTTAYVYSPRTWATPTPVTVPADGNKGESLSFADNGQEFLIGFEGAHAPLYWVGTP